MIPPASFMKQKSPLRRCLAMVTSAETHQSKLCTLQVVPESRRRGLGPLYSEGWHK